MLPSKTRWMSYFKYSLAAFASSLLYYHTVVDISQDLFYETPDFISKYGYPVESHVIKSQDGYLLTVHRIPHGREDRSSSGGARPVVFLQHGIMCSSDVWVYSGPDTDLPFMLADKGYDVWLGNARGNCYSDKHTNTSISNQQYWDFSWHEMGFYDLPAIIDYILQETKEKDLFYIGHSMGSTMFFVMASTKPEYNSKINMMVALAPVGTLQRFSTAVQKVLVPAYLFLGEAMKLVNRYQLLPRAAVRTYLINLICKDQMPTQFLCKHLAFGLAGESYEQYNSTALAVILSHVPAGSSEDQVLHFYQNMHKEKFVHRDLGEEENLRRYNQTEPPEYDLDRVTTPVAVYYGANDQLAPVKGVMELAEGLPNLVKLQKISLDSFNHFDFTWGVTANRLLYDDIIQDFDQRLRQTGRIR